MTGHRRQIKVSSTGSATAPGGYANTGVQIGDVNLISGTPVSTRYRKQVERIAPQSLLDREAELTELAEFCASPATAGTYRWWQGPAWAGKSALMATFVLAPPSGVRVVSFFITGRWSGQNNRAAFVDNVLEQLLALLGEPAPPPMESTREHHLLGLLDDAAHACHARGEQFVLLVDGLDEDRSVHVGADSHSIAALLPAHLPQGMRIIVTGRPNPPVPLDVPDGHPLRDTKIVRPLDPSPHAHAARVELERELKNLLQGTTAEQDLLGLTVAAGSGLTADDLAELSDATPYEVDDQLRVVTGRSFSRHIDLSRRSDRSRPEESVDRYVLAHEELQTLATTMLGATRLSGYRQRLHMWADHYRTRGWPPDTPHYLLREYVYLLQTTDDTARLADLVGDEQRHARTKTVFTGGDHLVLSEIAVALDVLARIADPDLVAIARIARLRDQLTAENDRVPDTLPALWAALGEHDHAVSLASSMSSWRAPRALQALARSFTVANLHERAITVAWQAAGLLKTYSTDSYHEALIEVVRAVAASGDRDHAATILTSIDHPGHRDTALRAMEPDPSPNIASPAQPDTAPEHAEEAARAETNEHQRAKQLVAVARSLVESDPHHARQLADEVETHARTAADIDHEDAELAALALACTTAGDLDRAETLFHLIAGQYTRSTTFTDIARRITTRNLQSHTDVVREQARELLTVLEPFYDITLETLETLMASAADRNGALNLAEHAKQLAHNLHSRVARRCSVLRCVSTALAASGHTDLARDLVADISGLPDIHAEALCAIADQLDHPDAERLIAQAFGVGRWTIPLDSLARIQPDTITVLTEQQLRHRHTHAEAPISDLDTALILTGTEQVLPTGDGAAITQTRYTPFEPDTLPQWEVAIQFAEWRGERGDAAAAASAYAALLPDALRTIGFSDARTRRIWAGTAYWTAEAGDLAGGIRLFVQLYQECVNTLGQHDPESLATKRNIATLAANDGHYEAAAELFVELLDAYTQTLGPDHAETSAVRTTLNQLNRALEGKPDARP